MAIFFRLILLAVAALFFTSCHVSSETALEGSGGRMSYNESLQATNNEQMLLNLVRLRYLDTPFFLDVGNVTTQFTYKTAASPLIPIPGFTRSNPFSLGGEFSWQNQPTIQYTPLEGQAFASQLLHPISLKTIQQLILSGWHVGLVFKLAVQSFDEFLNAPAASGPIPGYVPRYKSFFEVTDLFRHFQMRSQLQVGVKVSQCEKEGTENGYSLQIAFPDKGAEAKKLAHLLSAVHSDHGAYLFDLNFGFNQRGKIGIMSRSILSCLYYLSSGIDVPEEHVEDGLIPTTLGAEGKVFDWQEVVGSLLRVRTSSFRPRSSYVSVKYKGNWFYIEDNDLASKKTFVLLLQIYNLQSSESKSSGPILTLPIGS